MIKSANIMRLLDLCSWRHTGKGLERKTLLDYGCGWGRLLRLAYRFSPVESVYGIDPMDRSIEACQESGLGGNVAKCEALPDELPFSGTMFDFIWCYSVFTHLNLEAMIAILTALRKRIAEGGAFALTIRPKEFWNTRQATQSAEVIAELVKEHERSGYSYFHGGVVDAALGGTYGETSISFEKLGSLAAQTGWRIAGIDRDAMEPIQVVVTLVPA